MAEHYYEGTLVELPSKPDYGLGKVLRTRGDKIYVFFRHQQKKEASIFNLDNNQLIKAAVQTDPVLDRLPPFIEQSNGKLVLTGTSKRWTLQQTIEAFLTKFPLGFSDPAYLGDKGERKDKWDAHERFVESLGEGQGQRLLEEGNIAEITDRVLAIVSKAKMFGSFETMAIPEVVLLLLDKISPCQFSANCRKQGNHDGTYTTKAPDRGQSGCTAD